jgi:hypothetical protein
MILTLGSALVGSTKSNPEIIGHANAVVKIPGSSFIGAQGERDILLLSYLAKKSAGAEQAAENSSRKGTASAVPQIDRESVGL